MTNEHVFDGLTREQAVDIAMLDSHISCRNNTAMNKGWTQERVNMFDRLFPIEECAKADTWTDEKLLAFAKFIHE